MIPIPISWKLIGAGALAFVLFGWHTRQVVVAKAEGKAEVQKILDNERAEAKRVAEAQAAANRAASEAAAKKAAARESALQTQLKGVKRELWAATENLASCRLSSGSVRLLNDARDAGTSRPAAEGAD